MTLEAARQRAAQAWGTEKNKNTVMDPHLAEAFAEILKDEVDKLEKVKNFNIQSYELNKTAM